MLTFKIKFNLLRLHQTSAYDCLNKMPCGDELVKMYFRINFSNKDIVSLSAHKHNVVVSIGTL